MFALIISFLFIYFLVILSFSCKLPPNTFCISRFLPNTETRAICGFCPATAQLSLTVVCFLLHSVFLFSFLRQKHSSFFVQLWDLRGVTMPLTNELSTNILFLKIFQVLYFLNSTEANLLAGAVFNSWLIDFACASEIWVSWNFLSVISSFGGIYWKIKHDTCWHFQFFKLQNKKCQHNCALELGIEAHVISCYLCLSMQGQWRGKVASSELNKVTVAQKHLHNARCAKRDCSEFCKEWFVAVMHFLLSKKGFGIFHVLWSHAVSFWCRSGNLAKAGC